MEYHETKALLHAKQLLGHKNIQNTMVYVNLDQAIFTSKNDQFHAKVVKNTEEAWKLCKQGLNKSMENTATEAKSSGKENESYYPQ